MLRMSLIALPIFALLGSAAAQSCSNYGVSSGGSCTCPAGLGGGTCTDLVCANSQLNQTARPIFNASAAGSSGSLGCGSQCTDGFTGSTCNVCTSTSACRSAISSLTGSASSTLRGSSDSNVICSNAVAAYSVNYGQCDVVNPTLQSVFPGTTYLALERVPDPSAVPFSTDSISALRAGTAYAQLFYGANTSTPLVEQFYCSASNCTQTYANSRIHYDCSILQCTCVPGTAFCGASALDLTGTINGLSGDLGIDCDNSTSPTNSSTGQCYFKQSLLQSLFGPNGLALSGCQFGECVQQTVADARNAELMGASSGTNSLSGGVIAGLVVAGIVVAVLAGLLCLGYIRQRRARAAGGSANAGVGQWSGGAAVAWSDLQYVLPAQGGLIAKLETLGGGIRDRRMGEGARNRLERTELEKGALGQTKSKSGEKLLLDNVFGKVEPGTMLAILGPSGAGKSTLLDVLAGQRKIGRIGGTHSITSPHSSTANVTIAFVDQADILPSTSTVREALLFAAHLKLPEAVSSLNKEARVEEVLDLLGLRAIADSRIGNDENRGISGGERRRLSIGLEIIAKPSILFLDEPTSGLDSVSAMRVVGVLRNLSRDAEGDKPGTTIIASIHQPNSQIFHSFDCICLLALGGRQVYFGEAEAALGYFAGKGLKCPSGYNPADYMLEIASDPSAQVFTSVQAIRSSNSLKQRYPPSSHGSAAPVLRTNNTPLVPASVGHRLTAARPRTTALTQFEVLARREWNNLLRDPMLFWLHAAISCLIGLFLGGLYFDVKITIAGFQNRVGSLFFLGSVVAFSALSALNNMANVRGLFMRERAANLYSPTVWLFSRVVFDIVPLRLIPTITMSTIAYFMVGLSPHVEQYFKFILIIVELNVALVLFAFLMAALLRDGGAATLLSSLINLGQMVYAGFFVNLASIPPVLRWIQWLCPLKYALEAMTINEISNGLLIKDSLSGVNVQIGAGVIMDTLFGFEKDAYYRDVLVLFAFIAGFLVSLVWAVLYRLRSIR